MTKTGNKKKDKGEPKWYFKTEYKNGQKGYVPYEWAKGEREEYERISEFAWGGFPMDVNWAKSTSIYNEVLKKQTA